MSDSMAIICISAAPSRPEELRLPAELLYSTPFNCPSVLSRDSTRLSEAAVLEGLSSIRFHFKNALETHLLRHDVCSPCIVDDIDVECHHTTFDISTPPSAENAATPATTEDQKLSRHQRRRRRRRRRTRNATSDSSVNDDDADDDEKDDVIRRRRTGSRRANRKSRRRRNKHADPTTTTPTISTSGSALAIRFTMSTRLSSGVGRGGRSSFFRRWPDDYHAASERLRTAFDELDRQLLSDGGHNFRIALPRQWEAAVSSGTDGSSCELRAVPDSLTESAMKPVCSVDTVFDGRILLCGLSTTTFCSTYLIKFNFCVTFMMLYSLQ